MDLARDGLTAHRLARRANAPVLPDDGISCALIVKMRRLDDNTVRNWCSLSQEDGIEGLTNFGPEDGTCRLNADQQDKVKA